MGQLDLGLTDPEPEPFDLVRLIEFQMEARAVIYGLSSPKPTIDGHGRHTLEYKRGPWRYLKHWMGTVSISGADCIYHEGTLVWEMTLRGEMIPKYNWLIDKVEAMISNATRANTGSFHRGIKLLKGDELHYHNILKRGDVTSFEGEEWITHRSQRIWKLIYVGGLTEAGLENMSLNLTP